MGQTPSKSQGTLTFGYIATTNVKPSTTLPPSPSPETPTAIVVDPPTHQQHRDLVSERPELYALSKSCTKKEAMYHDDTSSSNSRKQQQQQQQQQLGRVDSGYNEDDNDERMDLKNDIDYIDAKYYRRNRFMAFSSTPTLAMQQQQSVIEEQPFTFIDACAGELNNRSMQEIDVSARRLVHLSPNISYLKMLQRLDLSHNALSRLPEAIGSLENLEFLCLSHNQLIELPDSISNLSNLIELDVSYNRLHDLTPCFRVVSKKLQTIHAENNFITFISFHVRNMTRLATFNLSDNPIRVLPAEITQLPHLRRLVTRGCPLVTEVTHSLKHDPPSLREICARIVVDISTRPSSPQRYHHRQQQQQQQQQHKQQINTSLLPTHLITYLQSAKPCSFCHGPYFEHHVRRGQWIEKSDGMVPLEHRLCTAHWRDDNDRLLHMFSANQPPLAMPSSNKKERRLKRDDPTSTAGGGAGTSSSTAAAAAGELGGGGVVIASAAATSAPTTTPASSSESVSTTTSTTSTTTAMTTTDRWRRAKKKINTHRWLSTKLKRPPL